MSSYRFDLENAIASWRCPFEHHRVFSSEDLEELEGGLRDRVEALLKAGLSEEAAFREALRRLGSYGMAEVEYRKVYWGKLRRRRRLRHCRPHACFRETPTEQTPSRFLGRSCIVFQLFGRSLHRVRFRARDFPFIQATSAR